MSHRYEYTKVDTKKTLKRNNIKILYLWMIEEHKGLISTSKHVPAVGYTAHAPEIDSSCTYYKIS